jgi:uncharacterized protein YecT (DUF1311 family)
MRNVDSIVTPLATLVRIAQPAPEAVAPTEQNAAGTGTPQANEPQPMPVTPAAPQSVPESSALRPSFSCTVARSRGEREVCGDAGLAALDRNMAAQYTAAAAAASPEQRDLLRETARRFYAYRDRCPNRKCIADAYVGRMREIRDIAQGRWQPPG